MQLLSYSIYTWQGTCSDGSVLEGELKSPSQYLASAQLLNLGVQVIKMRRKILAFRVGKVLKSTLRVQFTEQLADLVGAGISMPDALKTMQKAFSQAKVKTLFWLIDYHMTRGQSFGQTLRLFPREFDLTYHQLVEIGEISGQLEKVLRRLAELERKKILMSNKFKKASFYPSLVLGFSSLLVGFLLIGIVPKFEEVFHQANLELPYATLTLVMTSNFFAHHGIAIILSMAVILGIFSYFFQSSSAVKRSSLQGLLRLPWFGKVIKFFYLARFSYGLSMLLQVGIPLTQSLEMLLKHTVSPLYRDLLKTVLDLVYRGDSLSQSLKATLFFPDFMTDTLKIAEEAGNLVQPLFKMAQFYENAIDQFLEGMSIFLEPVLMVVLGLVIGIFMIALYLPIFSLGSAM